MVRCPGRYLALGTFRVPDSFRGCRGLAARGARGGARGRRQSMAIALACHVAFADAGDHGGFSVSIDPGVQGVRRGLPAHRRRSRHFQRTVEPASLQGVLRAEPAGLRGDAVGLHDRGRPGLAVAWTDNRRREGAMSAGILASDSAVSTQRRDDVFWTSAARARILGWILIGFTIVLVVGPFFWILMNSFKSQIAILSGAWIFTPTLDSYQDVLLSRRSDFVSGLYTSLIVATVSTAIVLVIGTLAAYSLHRFRWAR